jgi:chromosome segregation ATPase
MDLVHQALTRPLQLSDDAVKNFIHNQDQTLGQIQDKLEALAFDFGDLERARRALQAELDMRVESERWSADTFVRDAMKALNEPYIHGETHLGHLLQAITKYHSKYSKAKKASDGMYRKLETRQLELEKMAASFSGLKAKEMAKEETFMEKLATKDKKLADMENQIRQIRDREGDRAEEVRKATEKWELRLAAKENELTAARKEVSNTENKWSSKV